MDPHPRRNVEGAVGAGGKQDSIGSEAIWAKITPNNTIEAAGRRRFGCGLLFLSLASVAVAAKYVVRVLLQYGYRGVFVVK